MDAPVQIRAHAGRVHGSVAATLDGVLAPVLATVPRLRPVVVLAVDDLPTLTEATIRLVTRSGRRLGGVSEETVALRVPRSGQVRVPESWIGSTLVVVMRLGDGDATIRDALAHLARGLGAPERHARAIGAWLGAHLFATVVAVVQAERRLVCTALPHRARAATAVDAWLARRTGRHLPMPAGYTVRTEGDAGPWTRTSLLERPLTLANRDRERR